MKLLYDTHRCTGNMDYGSITITCKDREHCARYTQRMDMRPRTPMHDAGECLEDGRHEFIADDTSRKGTPA